MRKWFKEIADWIKHHFGRKFTVPFHIISGVICVLLIPIFQTFGIVLLVSFGFFEWWQSVCEGDEGHLDFWDFMFGAFITSIPLIVLGYLGLV